MFVGLNLMFHAAITDDPLAIRILESTLGIEAKQAAGDVSIPLDNYEAREDGWSFDIDLPEEQWILLPMGMHAGTSVEADGEPVEIVSVESLTLARLPEGLSSVRIHSEETSIYTIGRATTIIGVLAAIYYLTSCPRNALISRIRDRRKNTGLRSIESSQINRGDS